jgi:predicted nucleic acid-binding protein
MSSDEAHEVIRHFNIFPVVEVDSVLVNRAIETLKQYHISYWDSLIVAAAERTRCSKLLSEDFNSGQLYHEILAVDPFKT